MQLKDISEETKKKVIKFVEELNKKEEVKKRHNNRVKK